MEYVYDFVILLIWTGICAVGVYGFELARSVGTRDEFVDLLRDQAGVSLTCEARETPTLVVRRR